MPGTLRLKFEFQLYSPAKCNMLGLSKTKQLWVIAMHLTWVMHSKLDAQPIIN